MARELVAQPNQPVVGDECEGSDVGMVRAVIGTAVEAQPKRRYAPG